MATDDTNIANRLKALDQIKNPPGQNFSGSAISAMNLAQQKAQKQGQPLDVGQLAQQAVQQTGQKVQQADQQASQVGLGVQQGQLQQQSQQVEQDLFRREEALKKNVSDQEMTLRKLSSRLGQELHEDTTKFKRDELGRAFLNEKQLADYAVLQAKNQEELQNFIQLQSQMHERKAQMLKVSYQKIEQALKQVSDMLMQSERLAWDSAQQRQAQLQKEFLIKAKIAAQEKMAQEDREARKAAAGFGVLTSAMQGAAAGSAAGPYGALAGAAGGAAVGGIAYASQK